MDTRFLESFVAVCDAGSLAAAARRLNITAAAVAQRMKALEDEIGVHLVTRVGRRVQPTERGLKLLERARQVTAEIRALKLAAFDDSLVGNVRIGAINTALTGLLPGVLKRLSAVAPGLDIFILPGTSHGLYDRVLSGDLDAAIIVEPAFAMPKSVGWSTISDESLILITSQDIVATDPLQIIKTHAFVRYDRNNWGGQLADEYMKAQGLDPKEMFELDSLDAISVMVSSGLGVSIVPDWSPPWPAGLRINKIALPGAPARRIGLLQNKSSSRQTAVRLLRDLLF
jgi:DNA-binding transcriptional LysR family regulator